jgi:hypothetical protein
VSKDQCTRYGPTGNEPRARGSSSDTEMRRSVARGGTGLAGGIMTSSKSCRHVEDRFSIPDSQLPRTSDGRFPRAAYIYFRTEKERSLEPLV